MRASFEQRVRRSLLVNPPRLLDVSDQIDCADACADEGAADAARMLYDGAFIRQGFSPQQLVKQSETAARTALWRPPLRPIGPPREGGTVATALSELRRLAALPVRPTGLGAQADPVAAAALGRMQAAQTDAPPAHGIDLLDRLHAFLRSPAPSDWGPADALLGEIGEASRAQPEFDWALHAGGPLDRLLSAYAFATLQRFLLANQEVLGASARFLHAVARLDSFGLGPYFRNVGMIARHSADVFSLARIAAEAAAEGGVQDPLGRAGWLLLLSRHLAGDLLNEVVDDLGDLGDMAMLDAMLARAWRNADEASAVPLVWRLRDAALDNGEIDLAIRAQELVARLRPDQPSELRVLGDIQATAGRVDAAERTFLSLLRHEPGQAGLAARLQALRAGRFDPFRVLHGYATPTSRLRVRLQRQRAQGAPRPSAEAALAKAG